MYTLDDIPTVLDIPSIEVGVAWKEFKLQFWLDKDFTVPRVMTGVQLKSQIRYPGTDRRYTVTVAIGATLTNELRFSLSSAITSQLTQGLVNWDVLAFVNGDWEPLAKGAIPVYELATGGLNG